MRLIEFIHKYFGFNKRERNGLLILCSLIVVLILLRLFIPANTEVSSLKITKISPDTSKEVLTESIVENTNANIVKNSTSVSTKLFAFDPNTISLEEAKSLGFKAKTASTLINFRNKGGKFYKKEDLKKLFGVSEELYNKLESFIVIAMPEKDKTEPSLMNKKTFASPKLIELNSADSTQLVSLPMIGASTAKKIIKFRNRLGGFYSLEQLKEVYGMKDSVFQLIAPRLTVSAVEIKKIDINSISYEELKTHPYINHIVASTLIAYKYKHGNYKTKEDLKKVGTLNDELINKIINYIDFN